MIKTYINGVLQESGGSVLPPTPTNPTTKFLNGNVEWAEISGETASTIITKIGDGSKINSNYLPSYVDDVLEYSNLASFPVTGEVGKIYIALDVNLTYRWSGSAYVEISSSIALGETSATAYRGDRGKIAYDHSQLTSGTNPHNTTFANIASKPTTVAGFGITDGVTLTGTETLTNKTLTAPVLNGIITGTGVTTTGEASKLLKFSSVANTLLHFLRIRKSSTSALNVQDDSSVDVFNVDTINKVATSYNQKISGLAGTGTRMVTADASGNLSAPSYVGSDLSFSGRILSNVPYVGNEKNYNIKLSSDISNNGYLSGSSIAESSYYSIAGNYKSETATSARMVLLGGDSIFYGDTGLTAGGTFTPTERMRVTPTGIKVASLAGTGNRMVVADSSGNLSASSIFLRGSVVITSGSTITVTLPYAIPSSMYAIYLTVDRADYDGVVTCTSRDRLLNEFKIHYYAGDGGSGVVHWLLSY